MLDSSLAPRISRSGFPGTVRQAGMPDLRCCRFRRRRPGILLLHWIQFADDSFGPLENCVALPAFPFGLHELAGGVTLVEIAHAPCLMLPLPETFDPTHERHGRAIRVRPIGETRT